VLGEGEVVEVKDQLRHPYPQDLGKPCNTVFFMTFNIQQTDIHTNYFFRMIPLVEETIDMANGFRATS